MQYVRSGPVEVAQIKPRRSRSALCDHCRSVLGEKRVLTRDGEGRTRRFCSEDAICIETWRRYNQSVFRR